MPGFVTSSFFTYCNKTILSWNTVTSGWAHQDQATAKCIPHKQLNKLMGLKELIQNEYYYTETMNLVLVRFKAQLFFHTMTGNRSSSFRLLLIREIKACHHGIRMEQEIVLHMSTVPCQPLPEEHFKTCEVSIIKLSILQMQKLRLSLEKGELY